MAEPEPEGGDLEPVLVLAREIASAPPNPDVERQGRRRVMELAGARGSRGVRGPALVLSLAAAAGLAAAVAFVVSRRPLTYEVRGAASSAATGYVGARLDAPAEVRFSDGSRVTAEAGARVRIDDTRRNGARVLVETGAAAAAVEHGAGSSWLFVAGPYEVHVTGTRFRLSWDPLHEEMDLRLDEGSVAVESAVGPNRVDVHAGQRFHASAAEGSMRVESATGPVAAAPHEHENAVAETPSAADPGAPPKTEHTKPPPSAQTESKPHEEAWPDLAKRGQFQTIVSEARTRGIDACLASAGAADVRALADASRYVGDTGLAERSLETLRRRFPGSANWRAAAFLLGRTHESAGDVTSADRWYRTYLEESPSAEFAADALAGRMRVASAVSGRAAAKSLALDYLSKYPDGVHSGLARKLAGRE